MAVLLSWSGSDPTYTTCRRHPDKNPGNPEEANAKFQQVHAAYQKLTHESDSDDSDDDFFMSEDMEDAFAFFMNM